MKAWPLASVFGLLVLTSVASAADPDVAAVPGEVDPFAKGMRTYQLYASPGFGVDDDDDIYRLQGGVGYHLLDNLSANVEGTLAYTDVEGGDNGVGAGISLLMRYHFWRGESWSSYLEGGSGALFTSEDFPRNTNKLNFASEFGMGGTRDIGEGRFLMGGLRYLHISNAGLDDRNPGVDSIVVYFGMLFGE